MDMTANIQTLAGAFVKAQKGFEAATKESNNPHFRSKYADLANCVDACKKALNDNGIAFIQKTRPHDNGVIVETVFIHETGEQMSGGELFVPAQKMDAQGFGSALTYARRYSLLAATGIAPEDDDGNAASKRPAPVEKPAGMDASKKADLMLMIRESANVDELKNSWTTAVAAAQAANDAQSVKDFNSAKDARKKELA